MLVWQILKISGLIILSIPFVVIGLALGLVAIVLLAPSIFQLMRSEKDDGPIYDGAESPLEALYP